MKRNKILHIIGSTARTLLALTFLFSGFVKAIDPLGTTYKIEDYLKAFGGLFNHLLPLAETAAILLISIELLLGICMLLNIRTRWTTWISALFYAVMLPLTLYIAIANPVSDCGCFGDAIVLSNWATFWKNVVLTILVIILILTKKYIPQTFALGAEITFSILGAILSGALMSYSLLHLPPIDFRPYRVGNNIPALMEIPEDAEPDLYDFSFIYEKEGVQKEFTLDNYPKNDSTWTFVEQRSVLLKKGYEPPIHDFEIITLDFEDITYEILESAQPVTLVIMYDLAKTNRKEIDKIQQLYLSCLQHQQPFYIVTGSNTQDIESFCFDIESTNLCDIISPFQHPNQTFCTCDPVTLKTIVRANPGVVVIQNGTIIDKYNIRNKTF